MTNDWTLRTELLEATHRWPLIMLFILLGCLVGVGASYLFPTSYQAETELHVSYNADIFARNPDDYKNWQMEELDVFVVSPALLEDTLQRLRAQDPAWGSVDAQQLGAMVRAYWRNAGSWRLVAEAASPEQASQLASAWQAVILEHFNAALAHARSSLEVEREIRAIAAQREDVKARLTELALVNEALQGWQSTLALSPPDRALDTPDYWELLALAARAASPFFAGQALFDQLPAATAPASDFLPWIEQAVAALQAEQELRELQFADLSSRSDILGLQWDVEIQASEGLTANLRVEALPSAEHNLQSMRPISAMALVGGISGLIGWGLVWLARPFLKVRK